MKNIKTEIFKKCDEFKVNTLFWDHFPLQAEENSLRNFPAPWIRKTIELLKIMGAKTMVEIGSTRRELTQNCISYYKNSYKLKSAEAPPCCQDGHSTYFWAKSGIDIYTVDIDESCITQLVNQYKYHIQEPIPDNLHIHIPQDGIRFLENFEKQIDFLYLDGWDVGVEKYAEKHLEAYLAAKDKLSPVHLVAIDDTDFDTEQGGKDKLLTPYLLENGYIKLLSGRQNVFLKTTDKEEDLLLKENEQSTIQIEIESKSSSNIQKENYSIDVLKIYDIKQPKVRLGNQWDGGYVIPVSLLAKSDCLFSYGLGTDISFELDFVNNTDKKAYCYDHEIKENPIIPKYLENLIYLHKEGLSGKKELNKNHFFEHLAEKNINKKIIFKSDSEGAEYDFFENTDLEKFSEMVTGIVIEFHFLLNEEKIQRFFSLVKSINQYYYLCHIHGNNYGGNFEYKEKNKTYIMPHFLEITFINKNLVRECDVDRRAFPDPYLDKRNELSKEEYGLEFLKDINI